MTALGLLITLSSIVIGGLALDVANAIRVRTQLQVAADAAAHAALYIRETENAATARLAALAVAETNMPAARYGDLLDVENIQFGYWDAAAQRFTVDENSKDSVFIDISQLQAKQNSVGTFFLRFVGVNSWDIRRGAVFETYLPACFREGFVAEDIVDVQSNNAYVNGFCIHSNTHVEVNSNNYFEGNTIVSMPYLSELVLPNSGFESNDGLEDALRSASYQMRILNDLPDIIDMLEAGDPTHKPDYISGGPYPLLGKFLDASDLPPSSIYTKTCTSNGSLTINANTTLRDIVLVTNCQVKFGNGVVLDNVVIATRNTGNKSFTGSHLQVGRDDMCDEDGGSQLLTLGGMEVASDLKMFGGQIIAMGDIDFAANANGIEGASFIAGGLISGTSNMTMGFCGDGMERNFSVDYFRLAM